MCLNKKQQENDESNNSHQTTQQRRWLHKLAAGGGGGRSWNFRQRAPNFQQVPAISILPINSPKMADFRPPSILFAAPSRPQSHWNDRVWLQDVSAVTRRITPSVWNDISSRLFTRRRRRCDDWLPDLASQAPSHRLRQLQ